MEKNQDPLAFDFDANQESSETDHNKIGHGTNSNSPIVDVSDITTATDESITNVNESLDLTPSINPDDDVAFVADGETYKRNMKEFRLGPVRSKYHTTYYKCGLCKTRRAIYSTLYSHLKYTHPDKTSASYVLRVKETYIKCIICSKLVRGEYLTMAKHCRKIHQMSLNDYDEKLKKIVKDRSKEAGTSELDLGNPKLTTVIMETSSGLCDVVSYPVKDNPKGTDNSVVAKSFNDNKPKDPENSITEDAMCESIDGKHSAGVTDKMQEVFKAIETEITAESKSSNTCHETYDLNLYEFKLGRIKSKYHRTFYKCHICGLRKATYSIMLTHMKYTHNEKCPQPSSLRVKDAYIECQICKRQIRGDYLIMARHCQNKHGMTLADYDDLLTNPNKAAKRKSLLNHGDSSQDTKSSKPVEPLDTYHDTYDINISEFNFDHLKAKYHRALYKCVFCEFIAPTLANMFMHTKTSHKRQCPPAIEMRVKEAFIQCRICRKDIRGEYETISYHCQSIHGMTLEQYDAGVKPAVITPVTAIDVGTKQTCRRKSGTKKPHKKSEAKRPYRKSGEKRPYRKSAAILKI